MLDLFRATITDLASRRTLPILSGRHGKSNFSRWLECWGPATHPRCDGKGTINAPPDVEGDTRTKNLSSVPWNRQEALSEGGN